MNKTEMNIIKSIGVYAKDGEKGPFSAAGLRSGISEIGNKETQATLLYLLESIEEAHRKEAEQAAEAENYKELVDEFELFARQLLLDPLLCPDVQLKFLEEILLWDANREATGSEDCDDEN